MNNQDIPPPAFGKPRARNSSVSNIQGFDQPNYYNQRRHQTEVDFKSKTKTDAPKKGWTGTPTGRTNRMPPKPLPAKIIADPFASKPSQRLTSIKTNDIFADNSKKGKSSNTFRQMYDSGGIPCRILHGGVKMRVQWDCGMEPGLLPFDPILVKFFEGLSEITHPYSFIAKEGCLELINSYVTFCPITKNRILCRKLVRSCRS